MRAAGAGAAAALRFPVGAAPRVRRLARGRGAHPGRPAAGGRGGDPAGQRRRAGRHAGRLRRRPDPVPACRGPRWPCRWRPRPTRGWPSAPRTATSPASPGRWPRRRPRRGRVARWPRRCWSAVAGPMARVFLGSRPGRRGRRAARHRRGVRARAWSATGWSRCSPARSTPGGSGRRRRCASSAAGCWPSSPTSSSPRRCRPPTGRWRSAPGTRLGVTVAGLALLVVVARAAGPRGAARAAAGRGSGAAGRGRSAARPGWWLGRALGADPVPGDGVLAAVGAGALAGASALVVGRGRHDGGGTRAAGHGVARAADVRTGRRCTVAEPSLTLPAPGAAGRPARRRGAGHQHRRRGHARPLGPRRRCSRRCRGPVCGPAATDELFGFSATGAAFRPVGISAGLAPVADARAVAALRRALAGADLVHAHGLRAGLVAAAARRLAPARPAAGPHPAQRAARAAAACAAGAGRARAGHDPRRRRGARRLRRPRRQRPPARRPRRPHGAGRPRRRCRRSARTRAEVRAELGVERRAAAGRRRRPAAPAEGLRRPPRRRRPLGRPTADRPRWSRSPATGRCRTSWPPGSAPSGCRCCCSAAARDVADLLGAADVCVLPSRWEARSLTAQEALRSGTPLVATRTGGLPELLGDAAELVPVGDAGALADAVAGCSTDPAHAARLVEAGRAQAATWPDEAGTAAPAGRRLPRAARATGDDLAGPPGGRAARASWRCCSAARCRVAGAADDGRRPDATADRVLVVGVPGLTWDDVDPEATPELWDLAGESAIGALSVRAARSTTCLLDGWATLGAGNRARVPGPDEGLPPVPLPTVPLPERPAAPTPTPTGRRRRDRAAAGHVAGPLRPPGAVGRARRSTTRATVVSAPPTTRAPPASARSPVRWAPPSAAPRCRDGPRPSPSRPRRGDHPPRRRCRPGPRSSPACWRAARSRWCRSTS